MIRPFLLLALVPILAAQEGPPTAKPAAEPAAPSEQFLQAPEQGRFKNFFQPFRTDMATLSPDGKHLAYSIREGETLSVAVIELEHPEKMKALVKVIDDTTATPMMSANQHEKTPGRINWMRWTTPTRLVVETNRVFTQNVATDTESNWQNWTGTVLAFDADGGNARQIASPEDVFENNPTMEGSAAFYIRRNKDLKFNSRVQLADEPMGAAGTITADPFGFGAAAGPLGGTAPDPEAEPTTPVLPRTSSTPRNLRIFDLDPTRPGAVTIIASGAARDSGNRQMGFFSLDSITGKLTSLVDDFVLTSRVPRIDRQGRIRLTVSDTLLSSFPLDYTYLGAKGDDRPRSLGKVTGLPGFSVSPDNYFGERAIPLGFDENPDILYYAANLGRDTFGIYSWDLATGKRGRIALESPSYDMISPPHAGFPALDTLVFDRFTHELAGVRYDNAFHTTAWLRPELLGLQSQLEKMFPGRSVEIKDWDESGKRFLLQTEGPADAGAFYLFDREQNKLMEFVRRAPWIDNKHTFTTLPFSYALADGARISGLVTVPQQPRIKPIPMVVLCPDVPWQRVRSDFQTEIQALTDMGFAVVQLNGRGAWGLGLKQRQAITAGYDLLQVEDIVTTVTNLEKIFAVNTKRVALLGRGHGGFIALRALQEHPDKFRCAITLDAPVNLADWLAAQRWSDDDVRPHLTRAWLGDAARIKAAPLTKAPEKITKPVLMLSYPGLDGQPRLPTYAASRSFASSVRRHGGTVDFEELSLDYTRGLPAARSAVFDQIEAFLNTHVYNYKVKIKDLKVIDKDVSKP